MLDNEDNSEFETVEVSHTQVAIAVILRLMMRFTK